jgi:hypothetical protein
MDCHTISQGRQWETVASDAVDFQFIPGHLNPADILSKHWGYQPVWASAERPTLFWQGDTTDLIHDKEQPTKRKSKEVTDEIFGSEKLDSMTEAYSLGNDHQPKGGSNKSLA